MLRKSMSIKITDELHFDAKACATGLKMYFNAFVIEAIQEKIVREGGHLTKERPPKTAKEYFETVSKSGNL